MCVLVVMSTKVAGQMIYLVENLSDARLRCDQLKRYLAKAMKIIEKSSKRDHFYEVAGDILNGVPDAIFKLDKALDATALAASRLDYEELKQQLSPEKVDELEEVLEDVRIKHLERRSLPKENQVTKKANPNHISDALLRIASEVETASISPRDASVGLASLMSTLSGFAPTSVGKAKTASVKFAAAPRDHIAGAIRRVASAVQNRAISPEEASNRLAFIRMALSQTAQQAVEAMGPVQANSEEAVRDGFKKSNPALTESQLNEIVQHWRDNKDVVKDKHSA